MANDYDELLASEQPTSPVIGFIVIFILGALLGGGFQGRAKEQAAIDCAVQTTSHCEVSYRSNGFNSVTACLKGTIDKAEAEMREDARAEGYDPRR